MNFITRTVGNTEVVEITGDVDLKVSPLLRKSLFAALKKSEKVAVNLSNIAYIDSSGIAVFIESLRESQKLGNMFVLFGMSPKVYEVFKLTHVLRIFQIFENEAQALGLEAQ